MPSMQLWVVLSGHVSTSGSPVTGILNKISITLINLEPEATLRNLQPDRAGGLPRQNPAISLTLSVLVAANFEDYEESLKFVGSTLAFFQGHSVFNPQSSPAMPAGIDRLVVELETTNYQQWGYLWGMLGSKYMPGVVYKLRLVTIQNGAIQGSSPAVGGLGVNH